MNNTHLAVDKMTGEPIRNRVIESRIGLKLKKIINQELGLYIPLSLKIASIVVLGTLCVVIGYQIYLNSQVLSR